MKYAAAAVWLIACYVIGQTINAPAKATDTFQQTVQESEAVRPPYTVTFQNAKEVSKDEIPWGFTAGEITLEDDTTAWLLTPGSSLILEGEGPFSFQYAIHPWMQEISDGAVLTIKSGEAETELPASLEWHEYNSDEGITQLEISVSQENDVRGDWIILK